MAPINNPLSPSDPANPREVSRCLFGNISDIFFKVARSPAISVYFYAYYAIATGLETLKRREIGDKCVGDVLMMPHRSKVVNDKLFFFLINYQSLLRWLSIYF